MRKSLLDAAENELENIALDIETPDWANLGKDVLLMIFDRVHFRDFANVALVCKRWRQLVDRQPLRKRHIDFGRRNFATAKHRRIASMGGKLLFLFAISLLILAAFILAGVVLQSASERSQLANYTCIIQEPMQVKALSRTTTKCGVSSVFDCIVVVRVGNMTNSALINPNSNCIRDTASVSRFADSFLQRNGPSFCCRSVSGSNSSYEFLIETCPFGVELGMALIGVGVAVPALVFIACIIFCLFLNMSKTRLARM